MINILSSTLDPVHIMEQYPPNSIQRDILDVLTSSNKVYQYRSEDQLKFELDLRDSIVKSSIALYKSRLAFRTFKKSRCNPEYWERTEEGGFLLKKAATPSKAIKDIYINTPLYGTECATAIVIIYYKAILNIYPEELFNTLFNEIYLMNWQHLDPTLGIRRYDDLNDYLPGDCRYFKNPDVDPVTPEWQGENVIYLGDGKYFGHGIGIGDAKKIIFILNKSRINGSKTSAYLIDAATRPNFKSLADRMLEAIV